MANIKGFSEHQEQCMLIQWWVASGFDNKYVMYATPNGGFRNKVTAINLKREGVKAGVPDLFLAHANQGYHGLYIEMKVEDRKKGKVSTVQKEKIDKLLKEGYSVHVCYGCNEAIEVIKNYLKEITL